MRKDFIVYIRLEFMERPVVMKPNSKNEIERPSGKWSYRFGPRNTKILFMFIFIFTVTMMVDLVPMSSTTETFIELHTESYDWVECQLIVDGRNYWEGRIRRTGEGEDEPYYETEPWLCGDNHFHFQKKGIHLIEFEFTHNNSDKTVSKTGWINFSSFHTNDYVKLNMDGEGSIEFGESLAPSPTVETVGFTLYLVAMLGVSIPVFLEPVREKMKLVLGYCIYITFVLAMIPIRILESTNGMVALVVLALLVAMTFLLYKRLEIMGRTKWLRRRCAIYAAAIFGLVFLNDLLYWEGF